MPGNSAEKILDIETARGSPTLLLERREGVLSLRSSAPGAPGAVVVDFSSRAMEKRLGQGRKGLIARAIAIGKRGEEPSVCDATCGLGRDAMVLAFLGCTVTAYERHPVVGALLGDGLLRARARDDAIAEAAARINLVIGDVLKLIDGSTAVADVFLIDPMFPERHKKALARKEAQILQALVGKGEVGEDEALARLGLEAARRWLVVKRPLHAPALLPEEEPEAVFRGRSVRYDRYRAGSR